MHRLVTLITPAQHQELTHLCTVSRYNLTTVVRMALFDPAAYEAIRAAVQDGERQQAREAQKASVRQEREQKKIEAAQARANRKLRKVNRKLRIKELKAQLKADKALLVHAENWYAITYRGKPPDGGIPVGWDKEKVEDLRQQNQDRKDELQELEAADLRGD